MEVYETEEQQVEAVKKWFKENGVSLIFGVVVGLSSVGGWKYYQEEQNTHSVQASEIFVSLSNQILEGKDAAAFSEHAEELANNYSDTPYAALASLMLAKHDYENGKTQAAISKLSWASKNAQDVETQHVAKTRLIRVYLSEDMFEEAEALLNMQHPESFDVSYEELKGDLLVDKNELAEARAAYDKAILLSGADVSPLLQLKRQQLGN